MERVMINRMAKFIEEIKSLSDQAQRLCNILDAENAGTAQILLAKLKSVLSRFTVELHNYFNTCQHPDADAISDFTTYQLQAEDILAELDAKLTSFSDQSSSSGTLVKNTYPSTYSKLPDLNLPVFSGELLEWGAILVSKLGDAARLIDGFNTTNKNFQIAVDTLKARYGKENEIIQAHHRALNSVRKAERMEECQSTFDVIERHLRVLNSMGDNINTIQMKLLIMEKFPAELIYETKMRLCTEGTESVESMIKHLSLIITLKEEARRIAKCENTTSEVSQPQYTVETLHIKNTSTKDRSYSTKNLTFNKDRQTRRHWSENKQENKPVNKRKYESKGNKNFYTTKRKKWPCVFCGGDHLNADCVKVNSLEDRKAKLKGKCFLCFRSGHYLKDCRARKKNCRYCHQFVRHNQALCLQRNAAKEEKASTSAMHINMKGSTVLQTAVVNVRGHNGVTKSCRILLDCGSQRTYITQEMATNLNLQTETQDNLAIFTFGSKMPYEIKSPLVTIEIVAKNNTVKTINANVVPAISQGVTSPQELLRGSPNERYPLADDGSLSDRIDILLGNDYYYTIMSTRKICIGEDLYLVESELGWILSGRMADKEVDQLSVLTYFQSSCEVGLNQPDPPLDNGNIQRLWDLESIGITDSPKLNRDEEAIRHFNQTTDYQDNRYFVSWPWNESPTDLPSNFGLSFGRLVTLLKRLDTDTLRLYDKTLKEQLEMGIIEEVPIGSEVNHAIHYIPHHGVSAPGKSLRIVYDASAKTKDEKSLNEHLYCGPVLLEDLTGLILKFRSYAIGLTADVEKAFLQIGLKEKDRDVTRFLWVKDINKPANENNLIHYRFTRVPFGVVSSPFILNATIKHHLSKAEKENVRKLANDIYVDNLVTGTNNTQEALDLYRDIKERFKQISMNLRQWVSNSEDFLKCIPDACHDKIVKLLGLDWHLEDDSLRLRIKKHNIAKTKREILRIVASVYDPCGYAVPLLLPAKILLQDLCKMKVKWDTPLPTDIIERWETIQQDLDEVKDIQLPRCYIKRSDDYDNNDFQIHCFTDSSTKAYGAVVYIVGKNGKSFVIGKSRLVPVKDQDHLKIPRLELLGVLIGSRLIKYVLQFVTLKITKQVLWTDSQIVINWINSDKLLIPFVSRRIEEIKRNKALCIRYVPSEQNPADVATKSSDSKGDIEKWLNGPDFLLQDPINWPKIQSQRNIFFVGEDLSKLNEIQEEPLERDLTKSKKDQEDEVTKDFPNFSVEPETKDSTLQEIRKIQEEHFREEVNGKDTNLSRTLGLFKDIDGILRCKGRLKYAEWTFDKRYPIIIPKDCEFTNRIIMSAHESNYHVGVNHTLSIIRQTYWIPQGKSQVKKILNRCPRCVKHGGGPFKLPPTPAIPHERVNYSKPLTFTGVDYLGPVLVKTEKGTSKRWICLFTCLAVRAVHLEVVEDLSAEEGLLALRRMISTRGVPTLIISDNALHFKLIADIVANAYCVENKIKWRFIPELAPWHGGFYERLVGLIKHCMRRTLQKHLLRDSQLLTIIKEIEAVVNTRPLTCVDAELEHVLKPSDFLQIGRCIILETASNDPVLQGTSTKLNLIKGWKKARIMLEEFKEMFRNRYLPSLRERYSHSHKQPRVTSKLTPNVGQIVQIKGDKNREDWKVGKIVSLIQGSDGLVRVARVKVGDTIFTRSIAHLYPLEVEEDIESEYSVHQNRNKGINMQIVPDESPQEDTVDPDVVIEEQAMSKEISDDVENEKDKTDDVGMTDETVNVTNNNDLIDDFDTMNTESIHEEPQIVDAEKSIEQVPKRAAAVRALEKLREWTQNLMSILL